MSVRKIIQIEEDKCNGCGLCVPNCAEGAIQIIDGKAKLVKDSYCDGLGACLGHCPMDALHVIEREADAFDEAEAMAFVSSLKPQEPAHGGHGHHHGHHHHGEHHGHHHGHAHGGGHGGGCPGSRLREMKKEKPVADATAVSSGDIEIKIRPQLQQWPVQLALVPPTAPWFDGADVLVAADCVPFAYPNFHLDLLKGKVVLVGCPKLDDVDSYVEKLTRIFTMNNIRSVTVAHMEVPCCSGIVRAVETAVREAGTGIPVHKARIGIDGSRENW